MRDDKNIYFKDSLGKTIREIRISQNISQQQLASETNLPEEYIDKVEKGEVKVSLASSLKILKIAKALNIPEDKLLNF